MKNKGWLVRFVKIVSAIFSLVMRLLFSSWYRKWRYTLTMGIYVLFSGKQKEDMEFYLCLFFLSCLKLKAILIPEWPTLGWYAQDPFSSQVSVNSSTVQMQQRLLQFCIEKSFYKLLGRLISLFGQWDSVVGFLLSAVYANDQVLNNDQSSSLEGMAKAMGQLSLLKKTQDKDTDIRDIYPKTMYIHFNS